ncbi:MAG: FeoB-associated Cys-rich membrane protein [Lentimicrobiaceae bacterium]|jgi:hypothetical protein|nr:FeoB-associated Cys-rich membrane protein [Lentimicrobiaceae bacterium]
MLQTVIAIVIIAGAFAIAGIRLYKKVTNPLKGCDGCAGDCNGCSLYDLKKEIEAKNVKNNRLKKK